MLNFGAVLKAFDAMVMIRDAARTLRGSGGDEPPPPTGLSQTLGSASSRATTQLEATLTNVVVAALKEAFDRDNARLDLERAQLDEQRRRAEAALRQELRRQAADRELGRLRLLAGTALVGWIASIALLALRAGAVSMPARVTLAVGWGCLLASMGAAFTAQKRVSGYAADESQIDGGAAGVAALWLLLAGLAASAISLLL